MQHTVNRLKEIIQTYSPALQNPDEDKITRKPDPAKWSKLEILGHLVDSAQNNLRRFIVAQYEENPKIVYQQDHWVACSGYRDYHPNDLVQLWVLINKHLVVVLEHITEEHANRTCFTNGPVALTIEWLAEDYVKHLLHHLHQVLELEPVPYP